MGPLTGIFKKDLEEMKSLVPIDPGNKQYKKISIYKPILINAVLKLAGRFLESCFQLPYLF